MTATNNRRSHPKPPTRSALARPTGSALSLRLRQACNGHPYAKIPWPHRLLHEAADEIERLQTAIRETLTENAHLADGDVCTLIKLKRAMPPNDEADARRAESPKEQR